MEMDVLYVQQHSTKRLEEMNNLWLVNESLL